MDSNSVLEIFREITKIPRESGHEEKMTAYLQKFAAAYCGETIVADIGIDEERLWNVEM